MADSNTFNPRGKYKRRADLGSNQEADGVVDYGVKAGEDINNNVQRVGGYTAIASASFTRPSDTTTYGAGDVVGPTAGAAVITFAVGRYSAGTGLIVSAQLIDGAAVAALKGQFELWLFDTTFTPDADNAVFTPTDAECATLIGVISFSSAFVGDATAGVGGNCVYQANGLNMPFKCGAASQSIFGALVVRNAYVPVSAETFALRLVVIQD